MRKYKLAILTSHPIQYQTPLFAELTKISEIDLTVYFCWDFGTEERFDPEFRKKIKWDIPLLDGYKFKFLKNYSLKPTSASVFGEVNFSIAREIYREKYDAVLIYGWYHVTSWLAFLAAFLTRTPVFLRSENPLLKESDKPAFKIWVKKVVLGWLFRRAAAFLYIGEENKKFYEYYGVESGKLIFCPYAVDNQRFVEARKEEAAHRRSYRKELGIHGVDAVILFVGKLIPIKRPMDLLRAYEILTNDQQPTTNNKIHLVFVGDGELRSELEDYANGHKLKNVYFVGFKNQTELPKYYSMADVLVLPSESETWGVVINEAMCFSLPIVASSGVGAAASLVRSNQNGYVFKVGDVKMLSYYLECLAQSLEKRKLFGKKSLEIIENFSYREDIAGFFAALAYVKK